MDTNRPDTGRGSGSSSGQRTLRGVQVRSQPDTARGWDVRGGQRPSGQHLAALPRRTADSAAVSASADTCWGSGPGRRSRRTPTVRTRGQRTRLAAAGSRRRPALRTPATAAGSFGHDGGPRWTAGSITVHWPRRMSDQERDRNVRHRPAPPQPDRQIRRLMLRVDLVGSRRTWPAHVGCVVGPDGSRRVPSDRLDDQTEDQAAGQQAPRPARLQEAGHRVERAADRVEHRPPLQHGGVVEMPPVRVGLC